MLNSDDIDYFHQRTLEERERAKTARSPMIAEIHLALALKYEELTKRLNGTSVLGQQDQSATSPDDSASRPSR